MNSPLHEVLHSRAKWKMLAYLLLLTLLLRSITDGRMDIYIGSKVKGVNCKNVSSQTINCSSIEDLTKEFSSYSDTIIHVSGQNEIVDLVIFRNISNLSIIGEHLKPKARLVCRPTASHHHETGIGFQFENIHTLTVENVQIIGCGGEHVFKINSRIRSAIFIYRCRDVTIKNVDIKSSIQTSLFMENTSGNVSLVSVCIHNNGIRESAMQQKESFAGGLEIFLHECTDKSQYKIINCHFYNITTPDYTEHNPHNKSNTTGFGLGGGISIIFDKNTKQHNVLVNNCTFDTIKAPWGAGMHIKFLENCHHNQVVINNSNFRNSTAYFAGGGLSIGIASQMLNDSTDNIIIINSSTFSKNKAKFGAGVYIFAYFGIAKSKFLKFFNCSWQENIAIYSPAVDISPSMFDHLNTGMLPVPEFKDCNFTNNRIITDDKNHSTWVNAGVFVISRFQIIFEGKMYFDGNAFTALLLNSGQLTIQPNCTLTFINNTGMRGGAIALHSFSSIIVSDNCTVKFLNNTATEYGGAIYQYTTEIREFIYGRSCFLTYNKNYKTLPSNRNINFIFTGNSAPISGSAIFASSFHACQYNRDGYTGKNLREFFQYIGNFTFDIMNKTYESRGPALGTTVAEIINTEEKYIISSIPGMRFSLPLAAADEFEEKLKIEFFTQIVKGNSSIKITTPYSVNNTVEVYGNQNESAELIATTQNVFRILRYSLVIQTLPCPPGYYFDGSKQLCKCSSFEPKQAFLGITRCNQDNFTAVIQSGYWVGYYRDTLYVSSCPFQFCNTNTEYGHEYSLPNSRENLSLFICSPGREGVVCGKCSEGQSVFYHSRVFKCQPDDKCSFGIVFYILSELLPAFIFFTIVTIFDISFTTGTMNGFVFFSQIITILPQDFTRYNLEPPKYFQAGYNLVYRIFILDFFSVDLTSFCLFKGATSMDILAFKYITILFAFILVVAVILCMNYWTCCRKKCAILKKMTATTSVLHGLSAFIVICYTECVRVSFFILRQSILQGAGGKNGPRIAFYAGIDYLKEEHIPYAIPAIVSLGTIAVIPPIFLLFYPSILKVLQLCKLSEHRLVIATLRVTKINSLMPMFDVFQGCFKDNFRFFAGLYFFYRIAIIALHAFRESLFQFAMIAELILLVMLGTHSIVQPYKLRIHNIIDSLLFLDLAIINGLTAGFLRLSPSATALLPLGIYTQLLLIFAPIAVFATLCVMKLVRAVYRFFRNNKIEKESEQEFLEYLDTTDREMEVLHSNYRHAFKSK